MRRRQRPLRRMNGTFALNITSMTDMFTLLLVFLLQTYSTADFQPDLEKGISLPVSSSLKDPNRIPQVAITSDAIKIDGVVVAALEQGQPLAKDLDPQHPKMILPLFEALKAKAPKTASPDDAVLLHADAKATMTHLEPFLTTISLAGFAKVKLATVVGR